MVQYLRFFLSDQQVFNALKGGDDSALKYLYERNLRMVRKYILENSGTEPDVAEILQDALIVFWEKVRSGEFKLQSKISTYIFSVARNKWLQELGRKKRFSTIDEKHINLSDDTDQEERLVEQELIDIVKFHMNQLLRYVREFCCFIIMRTNRWLRSAQYWDWQMTMWPKVKSISAKKNLNNWSKPT